MVDEKSCTPYPLFGRSNHFCDGKPSYSPVECELIYEKVAELDSSLDAVKCLNISCDFLTLRSRYFKSVYTYKTILEKLLLWCFYIKKKSFLELAGVDFIEFELFYLAPPQNWLKPALARRFRGTEDCVIINEAWRPFSRNFRARNRNSFWRNLKKIVKELLPEVDFPTVVPATTYDSEISKKINIEMASNVIQKYLDFLFSIRTRHLGHEIRLFAFACAAYLRVNMRDFKKLIPYLYLNSIAPIVGGGFKWVVTTPHGQLVYFISNDFDRYYRRYCTAVEFNTEASPSPDYLVFGVSSHGMDVDHNTFNHRFLFLPIHPDISLKPYQLINLWADLSPAVLERSKDAVTRHKQTVKASNRKRKSRILTRLDGFAIKESSPAGHLACVNNDLMPFPIYSLRLVDNAPEISIELNFLELRKALSFVERSLIVSYVESIRVLLLYVYNNLNGGKIHPVATAYERFILWALLIKKLPPGMLNEEDVKDFFVFCYAPPTAWIGVSMPRVRGSKQLASNWRPFSSSFDFTKLRAADNILQCSRLQVWAIKRGLQENNIFLKFKTMLYNCYR